MPELTESITAIKEGAKEDQFTYLTILQYHVTSPDTLPTLNEVLEEDPQLTQAIGWDLVQMLLVIDGSEKCLETVARLGNPREVIIKVMEALERLADTDDEAALLTGGGSPEPPASISGKFIILVGMLAILHRRIKTKYPSRFLGSSLVKVYEAYRPTPEMTASVINLVRSLSGSKRPPLPTRKSSVNVANPDKDGDASKNAPDPEEEAADPTEEKMQQRLLQSFVTCVLQRYVNENEMQWSARLLEQYYPERKIPGKKTASQSFSEEETLQQRDSVVGQLVALARDIGLNRCSASFVKSIYKGATGFDPLAAFEDFNSPDEIHLAPGGAVCLIAYWLFSTDVFGADHPRPAMYLFPEHLTLLERFLGATAQEEITSNPGVADALLAIGLSLDHKNLITEDSEPNIMAYHHHLTLVAVFHPDIQVRSAATAFAGTILHSDPDDQSRLEILEDLLENCAFASLKACAVTWFKEELIAAAKGSDTSNVFSNPDIIDRLQYFIFPDELAVKDMGSEELVDYWAQNIPFLLQVANFAYYLFTGRKDLVPAGIGAAVEQRFVEPLIEGAEKTLASEELDSHDKMDLNILTDRLKSLPT
ncbi:YAP-binding/ALF4/Glomulin [Xylariales sp. AK1849]|nr:YAP-binding/ALF4/Glomulin [Xylariales sp. AK1849]